jgi:hypothetical protein
MLRAVEVAEQVVERPVLEQHEHDVVERVGAVATHSCRSTSSAIPGGTLSPR